MKTITGTITVRIEFEYDPDFVEGSEDDLFQEFAQEVDYRFEDGTGFAKNIGTEIIDIEKE